MKDTIENLISDFKDREEYLVKLEKIKKMYNKNKSSKTIEEIIFMLIDYYEYLLYDIVEFFINLYKKCWQK